MVGRLFVAISIHATRIGESADLRGRGVQTVVVFAALVAVALILLDRVARQIDSPRQVARTLEIVNPSTLIALGIAIAGGLMVAD